jgi:anti-sigma factor RsiW
MTQRRKEQRREEQRRLGLGRLELGRARQRGVRPGRAELHTLAGPYALDALPPRDRARFERHVAACEACAHEVRGLLETTARLAGAAAVPPAARLRERVLAEAARTRQQPPVAAGQGTTRWPWRLRRPAASGTRPARPPWVRRTGLALSAGFAAAAVAFGAAALVTQHSLSQAQARDHLLAAVLTAPDVKMMSEPVTGGGTAAIVMSHRERALAVSTAGLPALPSGKAYELWLMGPSGGRPAAMLPRPAHGMTSPVVATGLRAGDMVELTVEPAAGSPRPTTPPIMRLSV